MIVAVENGISKNTHNFMMRGITGFDERVRDGVGIENGEAQFSQYGADSAFAAGDAASESQDEA